jgi:hypothetical protein
MTYTAQGRTLYLVAEPSLDTIKRLTAMGWKLVIGDMPMTFWDTSRSLDSFPQSYHQALRTPGLHLLKEGVMPSSRHYQMRKFSLFKACLRENKSHPLYECLGHVRTRLKYSHGCLWCETSLIPLSILAHGINSEIFAEDHPETVDSSPIY